MAQILQSLNKEWPTIVDSPAARRALMRWSSAHPALERATDLDGVLELGHQPDRGPEVRGILAGLAPSDDIAARTLLQALLGGLCNLAQRIGRDGDAVDEVVSLAWERIRTYPAHRPGSVSGNVLLDVRKRYSRQNQELVRCGDAVCCQDCEPSPEDRVVERAYIDEFVMAGMRSGLSGDVVATIVRSRVHGESMEDLAAEQQVSRKVLWHRRWRGEARLRYLADAS